eukprot:c14492_g1_i1.p1 GENE.c14492_g1_i1~~c14492_g1_i1.p1  ORF type:complete len:949 (+),score=387.43 c14492_g1_i1:310-3156(+)
MYPVIAGGIVPIYNLPPLRSGNTTIILPLSILSKIFRGNITRWDHADILAANPNIPPQNLAYGIIVSVRSEFRGLTESFKKALSIFDSDFSKFVPIDGSSNWSLSGKLPTNFIRNYETAVTESYVGANSGSISYIAYAGDQLQNQKYQIAKLQKDSNIIVSATTDSIQSGLYEMSSTFNFSDPRHTTEFSGAKGLASWPIIAVSYILLEKNQRNTTRSLDQRRTTFDFWTKFMTSDVVSKIVRTSGYSLLPDYIREYILDCIKEDLKYEDKLVFESGSISNIWVYGPPSFSLLVSTIFPVFQSGSANTTVNFVPLSNDLNAREILPTILYFNETNSSMAISSNILTRHLDKNEYIVLPFTVLPLVLVANLCDENDEEQLTSCPYNDPILIDSCFIAAIFGTPSIKWNHPNITKLNPKLANLTKKAFPFFVEDDVQNDIISSYAKTCDPDFQMTGTSFSQAGEIVAQVVQSSYSVAIIPLSFALPVARRVNVAEIYNGNFGMFRDTATTDNFTSCFEASFDENTMEFDMNKWNDNRCYPLPYFTSISLRKDYPSCDASAGKSMSEFVQWLYYFDAYQAISSSSSLSCFHVANSVNVRNAVLKKLDSVTCDGECFLCPQSDHHRIGSALKLTFGVLALIVLSVAFSIAIWIRINLHLPSIEMTQPKFFFYVLLGCMICTSIIFPLATDVEYDPDTGDFYETDLNKWACITFPWMYCFGVTLIFSALSIKLWRLKQMFQLNRVFSPSSPTKISYKKVIYAVLLSIITQSVFLIYFEVNYPPTWTLSNIERDSLNRITSSVGGCNSKDINLLFGGIAIIHLVAAVAGNLLCYKCRDFPSQFAEVKWTSFAFFSWLQTLVVALPIFILVDDPSIRFALLSLLALVQPVAVIVFIFGPIIWIHRVQMKEKRLSWASSSKSDLSVGLLTSEDSHINNEQNQTEFIEPSPTKNPSS